MKVARRILWVDSLGALVVGALVVLLHPRIAELHRLSPQLVLAMGVVNLAYGTYSGVLASRRPLPRRRAVQVLVGANLAWTMVCAALLTRYGATASPFAWLHIGGEGLYVALLAVLEWRRVLPLARR